MPGAGKYSAAEGDREADRGAEAPERGAEGAREDVPAAAVPHELCASATARPHSQLPAPVKPKDRPSSAQRGAVVFSHLGGRFLPSASGFKGMRGQVSPLFPLPEEVTSVSSGCFVAHGSGFPVLVISLTTTSMLDGAGTLPGVLHGALGHVPWAHDSQSLVPTQAGCHPQESLHIHFGS